LSSGVGRAAYMAGASHSAARLSNVAQDDEPRYTTRSGPKGA